MTMTKWPRKSLAHSTLADALVAVVAVLQFSKGYFHTQKLLLYLLINIELNFDFRITCFLTAALQRCNSERRANVLLELCRVPAASTKSTTATTYPIRNLAEQVVLSGQGKSWWQANPTNCRIRSELKPLSSSLQSRIGIYHMSKEVVSPKIPDEDDSLKWGLIATNVVSKGVSSFFTNFWAEIFHHSKLFRRSTPASLACKNFAVERTKMDSALAGIIID